MMARRGMTLVEVLVALAAGSVALAGMAALLAAQERLERARSARMGRAEALRIAATVLGREFRSAQAADLEQVGPDSAPARLFRGIAVTCLAEEQGEVVVRWVGGRAPDPAKDSILPLVPAASPALPLRGSSRSGAACPGTGEVLRWQIPVAPPAGTPVLLFQRGVYSFSGATLRVRHGAEGRQPLTGDWLDVRRSGFILGSDPSAGGAWLEVRLALAGAPGVRRLRIPLPGAPPTSPPP